MPANSSGTVGTWTPFVNDSAQSGRAGRALVPNRVPNRKTREIPPGANEDKTTQNQLLTDMRIPRAEAIPWNERLGIVP